MSFKYSASEFLKLGLNSFNRVRIEVHQLIRSNGINKYLPTHRGTRAGVNSQRPISVRITNRITHPSNAQKRLRIVKPSLVEHYEHFNHMNKNNNINKENLIFVDTSTDMLTSSKITKFSLCSLNHRSVKNKSIHCWLYCLKWSGYCRDNRNVVGFCDWQKM